MFMALSFAAVTIFRSKCVPDRYQAICNDNCLSKGARYGVQVDAFICNCYGDFKNTGEVGPK